MLGMLELAPEPVQEMEIPEEFRLKGWVYVLSNECMPGIYKIGMTTGTPEQRAKDISQGTGVPAPFKVERKFFSDNPREDELIIHEELSEFRFNPSREFFKCSLDYIDECIYQNRLFQSTEAVSVIADTFSVISFEESSNLNLDRLFEDLGLPVFGDRVAIAERLIEMSLSTVMMLRKKGMSLVFSEGVATPIIRDTFRRQSEHIKRVARVEAETGIYGPQLPVSHDDIPF